MDNDSGDDGTDELTQFDWEKWEKEWSGLGWRNEFIPKARRYMLFAACVETSKYYKLY